MKREEQIKKAATLYVDSVLGTQVSYYNIFKSGAEWADKNPIGRYDIASQFIQRGEKIQRLEAMLNVAEKALAEIEKLRSEK